MINNTAARDGQIARIRLITLWGQLSAWPDGPMDFISGILLLSNNVKIKRPYFGPQCIPVQAQNAGRLYLITICCFQSQLDQWPFYITDYLGIQSSGLNVLMQIIKVFFQFTGNIRCKIGIISLLHR
jgi:hypothetical protein